MSNQSFKEHTEDLRISRITNISITNIDPAWEVMFREGITIKPMIPILTGR